MKHLHIPTEEKDFVKRLTINADVARQMLCGFIRDEMDKAGMRRAVIGLSGGIDSALSAYLAAEALGAENVLAVRMPYRTSSQDSLDDADLVIRDLGLQTMTVPITDMADALIGQFPDMNGLRKGNIMARLRMIVLYDQSATYGGLVVGTSNKTEMLLGYSTIYGDAVGGFAPIKDVPKTLVWALARWRNADAEARGQTPPIPPNSIDKPPSAELRPDQKDSDSLPDYALLDQLLDAYVADDSSAADLVAAGFDAALVERILRLTDLAEYKRRQYPPGTKISLRAFGRDRRLPITTRWRESSPS